MKCIIHVISATLVLGAVLATKPALATSPCLPAPIPTLLQLDRTAWIIAQVTVLEAVPGSSEQGPGARVSVERLFYGRPPSQEITVLDSQFLDCGGTRISNKPIGSSWVIGAGPRGIDLYGDFGNLTLLPVENGGVTGRLVNGDSTIYSFNLDELADFVTESYSLDGPGTLEALGIATDPAVVTAGEDFDLVFSGFGLSDPSSVEIDEENGVLRVPSAGASCFLAGNPPRLPNYNPSIARITVEGLPRGSYRVEATWGPDCGGETTSIAGDIYVFPTNKELAYFHESPRAGETVSGVGVIRGWACNPGNPVDIRSVSFSIDEYEFRFPLPHGSERFDTRDICYTLDSPLDPVYSGYGGVFYWGRFEEGPHTFTLYIDGEEVESFEFFVAEPPSTGNPEDQGYRKGASGEYVIDNFLGTDESVIIRWSEADQNFIIVEYN